MALNPTLEPVNPDYRSLVSTADDEDSPAVAAELIEVIGTVAPD